MASLAPTQVLYFVFQVGNDGYAITLASREAVVREIIQGQIEDPARVLEGEVGGALTDVSEDVARDIAAKRERLHQPVIGFIWQHAGIALANEMQAV